MLETLLVIIISLPFVFIARFFYKRSKQYQEDLQQEELKKRDEEENKNLEDFINLLEKQENINNK